MSGIKRKYEDGEGEQLYSNKSRNRPSEGRFDPTYGQKSAIPGLDDDNTMEADDEGLNYHDEVELSAMAYLRAVRLVLPTHRRARTVLRRPLLEKC